MITVSDKAKEYIHEMMQTEGKAENSLVRVGVKGGGCSGLQYDMKFDTEIKQGDQVFEDKGIKLVVELKSLLYLYGTELDYSGGLEGKGFFFKNPNASRTCACGESFAL
jgi:iron-sulfur cluster assembly protein